MLSIDGPSVARNLCLGHMSVSFSVCGPVSSTFACVSWAAKVRVTYMILEREGTDSRDLQEWLLSIFERKGDSRIVENVFREIRHDADKHHSNNRFGNSTLHAYAARCDTLAHACPAGMVRVTEEDLSMDEPVCGPRAAHSVNYRTTRGELPAPYSEILRPASETKWRNPTQQTDNVVLMRWLWLHHRETLDPQPDITAAWPSMLVPPKSVVSNATDGSFYFVLSKADSGVLAWRMLESTSIFGEFRFFPWNEAANRSCRSSSQIRGWPLSIQTIICKSTRE